MRYSQTTIMAATAAAAEVFAGMTREDKRNHSTTIARDQLSAALDRRPDHLQVGLALVFLETLLEQDS